MKSLSILAIVALVSDLVDGGRRRSRRYEDIDIPPAVPTCSACSMVPGMNGPQLLQDGEYVSSDMEGCLVACPPPSVCLTMFEGRNSGIIHDYCGDAGDICDSIVNSSCPVHIVRQDLSQPVLLPTGEITTEDNGVKTHTVKSEGTTAAVMGFATSDVTTAAADVTSAAPIATTTRNGPVTDVYPATGCPLCQNPLYPQHMPASCEDDPTQRGVCGPGESCLMVPFGKKKSYEFFGVERRVTYLCYAIEKLTNICNTNRWGDCEVDCNGLEHSADVGPAIVTQPPKVNLNQNKTTTAAPSNTTEMKNTVEDQGVRGGCVETRSGAVTIMLGLLALFLY